MMLDVQKSYNSLLPPAEEQKEEWLRPQHLLIQAKIRSWIKDAETERHA